MHQKRRLDADKISKFRTGPKSTGASATGAIAGSSVAADRAALLAQLAQSHKSSHYIPYSAPNEHTESGYDNPVKVKHFCL